VTAETLEAIAAGRACATIVAPMTVCGAPPADPIHGNADELAEGDGIHELSNGHRRHLYAGGVNAEHTPTMLDAAAVLAAGNLSAWDVNGPTPWEVT
jgi:hypothetical protein